MSITVEELILELEEKRDNLNNMIDIIKQAANGYVGFLDEKPVIRKREQALPRPIFTRSNGKLSKGNARSIAAKHWTQNPKNRKKVMAKVRAMNAARRTKPFWNQLPENRAKVLESIRKMNKGRGL